MSSKQNIVRELALLLTLSALWGASYTFIRIGVETIPPVTLIALRTLIAGAILVAILRWRGLNLPADPATWRRFLFQACLNSVVPFTLIAWAEQTTSAGLATILNSTSPIYAFLITMLLTRQNLRTQNLRTQNLRTQNLRTQNLGTQNLGTQNLGTTETGAGRKLFGVIAGLAGTCLIVGVEALGELGVGRQGLGGPGHELWAQLAIVAATVCYAGAAIFGRSFNKLDPMMPAAGSMICGAAALIPAALVVDRPWTLVPSTASVLSLLALSLFSTALAFVIYFRLVRTLGAVGTTAQAYLRVPVGVAIGVLFLGESLTSTAWLGLGFIVTGVIAMTVPARKPPASKSSASKSSATDCHAPRKRG
jgi:drug/metabolite transporter (DMT)-like permease